MSPPNRETHIHQQTAIYKLLNDFYISTIVRGFLLALLSDNSAPSCWVCHTWVCSDCRVHAGGTGRNLWWWDGSEWLCSKVSSSQEKPRLLQWWGVTNLEQSIEWWNKLSTERPERTRGACVCVCVEKSKEEVSAVGEESKKGSLLGPRTQNRRCGYLSFCLRHHD